MVDDLVLAILAQRACDAATDVLERVLPRHRLETTRTARADALHRLQDALGILDLIDRRRALRARAAAAAGVHGVAFEAVDSPGVLLDVREQAARGLAVEADRRDERIALLDALRPCCAVELAPVVPSLGRRRDGELPGRRASRLLRGFAHRETPPPIKSWPSLGPHARGRPLPRASRTSRGRRLPPRARARRA